MRSTEPWGGRRLELLLERAAAQEAKMWKVYVPKKTQSQDADISPAQRDEAVRWLIDVHRRSQLHPETLVLAVNILDRFLAPIKARPKYLRCIAITCFFLAAKTCEEDECIPSLKQLASTSSCGCSPSEILRMERIVLDKLSWNLHSVTALDFLHVFHAIVTSSRSGFSVLGLSCSQHLMLLTEKLYHCLSEHTLSQLRGSMLALALVSLELEACCPDWLPLTFDLLRRAQTDSSELIRSRELVSRRLSSLCASPPPNTVYIYQPLQRQTGLCRLSQDAAAPRCIMRNITSSSSSVLPEESSSSSKHRHHRTNLQTITLRCKASAKRKVEEMEVDDFYDGIKRLYNEDASLSVQEGPAGGGSSSPCPPLQPVSAT